MKRVVAVIVLVFFIVNCAPVLPQYEYQVYEREKPIVISERVGETIDLQESDQFELFHRIEEFQEARFYAIADGGFAIEILTRTGKLAALNRDPDAVDILRDYVDRYEMVNTDRASFMRKWGILDYDTLGIPVTEQEVSILVRQNRGRAIRSGCGACVGVSLAGLAIFAGLAGGGGGGEHAALYAGMTIVFGLGLGIAVGLITGGTIFFTANINADRALEKIKEARKPQPYGVRASARILDAVE